MDMVAFYQWLLHPFHILILFIFVQIVKLVFIYLYTLLICFFFLLFTLLSWVEKFNSIWLFSWWSKTGKVIKKENPKTPTHLSKLLYLWVVVIRLKRIYKCLDVPHHHVFFSFLSLLVLAYEGRRGGLGTLSCTLTYLYNKCFLPSSSMEMEMEMERSHHHLLSGLYICVTQQTYLPNSQYHCSLKASFFLSLIVWPRILGSYLPNLIIV